MLDVKLDNYVFLIGTALFFLKSTMLSRGIHLSWSAQFRVSQLNSNYKLARTASPVIGKIESGQSIFVNQPDQSGHIKVVSDHWSQYFSRVSSFRNMHSCWSGFCK